MVVGGVELEPAFIWNLGYLVFSLKITIEAMNSDIDEVALQGIEFWSNVCDEEMDLAIEASEVSLGGLICWKLCYSDCFGT